MKIDTFTCDTCKRAIDVPNNPSGVTMFPRCVITKNCRGLLSQVNKLFVSDEQYHNAGTSSDAWSQRPMIYDHTQQSPRKVWTINHGLGTQPILNVYIYDLNDTLQQLDTGDFAVLSMTDTTAVITFDTARTGVVQCVVRQSSSKIVYATTTAQTLNNNTTRLLYNQAMVIASKLDVASLSITINSNPLRTVLLRQNSSSLAGTPWIGTSYVTINNERYKVFGIDADSISAGSNSIASFWVSAINGLTPSRGESFVLLAKEPYQHSVDKQLSSVIDVSSINPTFQGLTSLVGSTLYCDPKLVASVYPPMEVIE